MQSFKILSDLAEPEHAVEPPENAKRVYRILTPLDQRKKKTAGAEAQVFKNLQMATDKPDAKTKTLKKQPKLTQERLKEVLSYDPETGQFTWNRQSGRQKAGDPAGAKAPIGYVYIGIDGERLLAHRLVWLYVYGKWPEGIIDHKDEDGFNNKLDNLQDVSQRQNLMATLKKRGHKPRKNTLAPGVSKVHSMPGKFGANIVFQQKKYYLGSFDTVEAAYEAYRVANKHYYGQDLPEYKDLEK